MWIARNKNGDVFLFKDKPIKAEDHWEPTSCEDVENAYRYWPGWFPDVQWEDDEPKAMFKISTIVCNCNSSELWMDLPYIIYNVIQLCEIMKIDIEWHVKQKMKYNDPRPFKHNKKY